MFAALRASLLPPVAALLAAVATAGVAPAGWVTLRNDTPRVVVVQETVTCNGVPKRNRPIRLLPGESVRQFQANGAVVRLEVFDNQVPARTLYTGSLTVREPDVTYAITASDSKTAAVLPAAGRDR